jgi:hypothetical protein
VVLAAVPAILLLTVTTHLTQDVAAIPFLWIVPLVLYLLTFILCFEASRLYWRWFYIPLAAAALGVAWFAASDSTSLSLPEHRRIRCRHVRLLDGLFMASWLA